MRFLIDECLSPKLDKIGHELDFETTSIHHLGKLAEKDFSLCQFAVYNGWTVIMHIIDDFLGKHGKPGNLTKFELHPGLICVWASQINYEAMEKLVKAGIETAKANWGYDERCH